MVILIADSGSTKTSWCVTDGETRKMIKTQGINPYQQTEEEISSALAHELVPEVRYAEEIYFYGAGCTDDKAPVVASALGRTIATGARIYVGSDMLGAARALCGRESGIVCILGTGSNSCLYDGKQLVENVSPLGYVLGDEGSGAYIGKRLVGNCLKRQFSERICNLFTEEIKMTPSAIINKVYREPFPNRFLASLSPFCYDHRDEPEIHAFLLDRFSEFFKRNVALYNKKSLPVHFIGSIAWCYRNELEEVASVLGFKLGNIEQSPMEGLIQYHTKK